MHFAFTEDSTDLRDAVRALLEAECGDGVVRSAWDAASAPSGEGLWRALGDNGVLAIAAPEALGGLGLGARELVLPIEEFGRYGVPVPVVETAAIAVSVLSRNEDAELVSAWLPGLLAGELRASASLNSAVLAPFASTADVFLVERDAGLFLVPAPAATLEPARSVDQVRDLAEVEFDPSDSRVAHLGSALTARRWGMLGASAFLLGLSQRMLDFAVEYAGVRTQFGKAIGTFQAVQHRLADARVALEFARPPVYRAAWSIDVDDRELDVHLSMAKLMASEAAEVVAKAALQVHGAIGYSTELDLHFYMKRAWALARTHGSASEHRKLLTQRIVHGASK